MKETNQEQHVLSADQQEMLLATLQDRFLENPRYHKNQDWAEIKARLAAQPEKLWSLFQMESTGGQPDVVGFDQDKDAYLFFDCAPESPEGRRSLCYDQEALDSRKKNKPSGSAMGMALEMGIELLTEAQYVDLQQLGEFDTATSSWLQTPSEVRERGGAIFGDRRYGRVFIYHNGAESYYGARGFRGLLRV